MSSIVLTILGVISLWYRIISYLFLRWLPGAPLLIFVYSSFPLYLFGWLYYNCSLTKQDDQRKTSQYKKTDGDDTSKTTKKTGAPSTATYRTPKSSPGIISLLSGSLTNSKSFNKCSLLVNIFIFLCCLDFHLHPTFFGDNNDLAFVRVGATTDSTVKLVARIPPLNLTTMASSPAATATESEPVSQDSNVESPVTVYYRLSKPVGKWIRGPTLEPSQETDWTTTATLSSLYPSTEYEYKLTTRSSSSIGKQVNDPRFDSTYSFKTFPDPRLSVANTKFTFATTSCMKPGFPYNPLNGPDYWKIPGAAKLADTISEKGVEFLVFVGDFIYADVPDPFGLTRNSYESYLRRFRQIYGSKDWQKVYSKLPVFHIYDDHEISNDYSKGTTNDTTPFQSAYDAFKLYQGYANYQTHTPSSSNSNSPSLDTSRVQDNDHHDHDIADHVDKDPQYFSWRYGDAAFFMLDTRKYRSPNSDPDIPGKSMLGQGQKQAFVDWLHEVNTTVTWKFVFTSVPFMTLWQNENIPINSAADTWAGFLAERDELMDIMEHVPNVVMLSGDRHEFAAAIIRNSVVEFSTGPLNMFYVPLKTLNQDNGRGKVTIDGSQPEDKLVSYIPKGQNKYTTLEVDTTVPAHPAVSVRLYIDGKESWNLSLLGKPVKKPTKTLGSLSQSLSELFGFRRSWF